MSDRSKHPSMPGSVGELLGGRLPYTYLERELVEYAEAMDFALQAIDGVLEIDRLKARVAELEVSLKYMINAIGEPWCTETRGGFTRAVEAIKRTPAQSLEERDAKVKSTALRDLGQKIWITHGDAVMGTVMLEAARIEKEAGI